MCLFCLMLFYIFVFGCLLLFVFVCIVCLLGDFWFVFWGAGGGGSNL